MIPRVADDSRPSMQRTAGIGRFSVKRSGGRTRLATLYQEGAAKIRMPRVHAGEILEAVLINTAGGLTGGDRLSWQVDLEKGTAVVLTTPTCEKIYRSSGGHAEVETRVRVGDEACFAYLPQETLVFEGSALNRRLDVDLAGSASALFVESAIFGRQAMGETVRRACFADQWRIRQDGRLIHADNLRFDGDVDALLHARAGTNGRIAIATVLMVHAGVEGLVDGIRADLGEDGGASVWRIAGRDKLVVRIVAESGFALRKKLLPVLLRCNKNLLGSPSYGLPKVWNL